MIYDHGEDPHSTLRGGIWHYGGCPAVLDTGNWYSYSHSYNNVALRLVRRFR